MKQKRPIVVVGDVAYVHLTKGYMATIDATDVPLVSGYNWSALVSANTVYAVRQEQGSFVYMHFVICPVSNRNIIDHKDRNGLNNRRKNLREATHQQNAFNSGSKGVTSSVKGVSFFKKRNKYRAQIMINGKNKHLGDFNTEKEAADAYLSASKELHGDFVKH